MMGFNEKRYLRAMGMPREGQTVEDRKAALDAAEAKRERRKLRNLQNEARQK